MSIVEKAFDSLVKLTLIELYIVEAKGNRGIVIIA
jgi:hypothetical protein